MQISDDTHLDFTSGAQPIRESAPAFGIAGYRAYFNAASRRTTLDMALYLARYSDLVLLVHGPSGSGKSTFMREMITRGGPNIHSVTASAEQILTAQSLCDAMLNSFKLITTQSASEPIAQIKEQLDLLQRKGYHCILFIDDADRLAGDAYPFLEALADLRSDTGRNLLNLVLFATQSEKITLAGPSVRHRIKATKLPPLDADEVAAYIQHMLRSSSADRPAVGFHDRDIQRIRRASSGWPGNINAIINQRLAHGTLNPGSFAILLNHPWVAPRYLLGATSITAALIFVAVFQDSINYLFETRPVISNSATVPEQIPALVQRVAAPAEKLEPAPVVLDTMPSEQVTAVSEVIEPETPTVAAEVDTPAMPVVATAPRRDNWLLTQDPDAYTLQIAGSSQEGDIRRALKKFKPAAPSAIFSASRKGKPWYGLVTGVYSDFASAKQARAALPEELMRGAWVRRLRAVQGEINKLQETTETSEQTTGAAAVSTPSAPPVQLP